MKKFFFPFEKLCLFLFYLEQMVMAPKQLFFFFSTMMIIASIIYEGGRPYTFLLVIIAILNWFQHNIAQMVVVLFTGFIMVICKLYNINVPKKGIYKVGYFQRQITGLKVCVFYPTHQSSKKRVLWLQKDYMKTIYEIFFVDPATKRLPYQLFAFALSYLSKIYMPVEDNVSLHGSEFDVMVWSHGLGANMNAHSSICCYWASHGRIVICINHENDKICVQYRHLNSEAEIQAHLYKSRNNDLITRTKEMSNIVKEIEQNNLLSKLFQKSIKINKFYLAGHSFGGATALQTYTTNKRSSKPLNFDGLILLDPWFFPLTGQTYTTKVTVPTLIINSDTFFGQVPKIYCLQEKLNKIVSQNIDYIKCLMVKKMDHLGQSDMVYVFGNILALTGTIKHHSISDSLMQLNQYIIQMFVSGLQMQQILEKSNELVQVTRMNLKGVQVKQEWRFQRNINPENQKNKND